MTEREQVLIGLAKTMAHCDDAACRQACMNAILYMQEHTAEWVSVKDRLPDDSEHSYLCIVSGNSSRMRFIDAYQEMIFCDNKWLCPEYPDAELEVSYWMEYPAAPVEVRHEV